MKSYAKRFGSISFVVAGIALALSAGSAGAAAHYVETPCVGNMYTDAWLWDQNWDDNWFVSQDCPAGYRLTLGTESTPEGGSGEFTLDTTRGAIQSVSVHVLRENEEPTGISVGIQACRLTTCGALVTGTQVPDSLLELNIEDDQIPTDADTLVVRTFCDLAICPEGGSVMLSDVQITRRDDTPPLLSAFEMDENYEPIPEASKWNNGLIKWGFEGGDLESQLLYFQAAIEDINICYSMFDPALVVPGCTMIEYQSPPDIFASQVSDGSHGLAVTLVNRAGLATTQTIAVKTDVTPPGQPHQFEVSPQFNVWQSSRDVRIDWDNSGETVESATASGIAGFTYDVSPKFGGINPPSSDQDPEPETVHRSAADSLQIRLPSAGQWTVEIKTFDRAGNFSSAGTAAINIDEVQPLEPDVHDIAPINAADRATGRTITWDPGEVSVSGRCGYDWAFAPIAGFNPGEDPTTPLLGDDPVELTLTPSQIEGLSERPQRFHLRGYSCAGVPGPIAHEPVTVDFTAPVISIAPTSGTLRGDEPVSIGVQDSKPGTIQSGVATVSCVVGANAVPCSNGSQLQLPEGQNHVEVTATDNAGNSSSVEADLTVDASPPTGWFDPASASDPTLVQATAVDSTSGLSSAVLEYRSASGGSWTRLGNGFSAESPTTRAIGLSARIPDDGELANGAYLLRLRATDATGAIASITRRVGGESAAFSVPVRSATVLSANLTGSTSSKANPLVRLGVKYGARPTLMGSLRRPDGGPIPGAQLTVLSDQSGSPARTIGAVTTAADGSYSLRLPAGGSRRLTVRFAGNLTARATAADAQLRVRGKVTLKASRKSIASNRTIRLRGKVYARGAALPVMGKAVELRFSIAGRRSSWKRTKRADAAGRFEFEFKYKAKGRPVRFVVRAVATSEPTWAFGKATSARVKFVVRP